MKKTKEELKQEMETNLRSVARERLLSDIFRSFKPHDGEGQADYEPTSVELAHDISETFPIEPDDLAIVLIRKGFKTKLVGTLFRWQIDYT